MIKRQNREKLVGTVGTYDLETHNSLNMLKSPSLSRSQHRRILVGTLLGPCWDLRYSKLHFAIQFHRPVRAPASVGRVFSSCREHAPKSLGALASGRKQTGNARAQWPALCFPFLPVARMLAWIGLFPATEWYISNLTGRKDAKSLLNRARGVRFLAFKAVENTVAGIPWSVEPLFELFPKSCHPLEAAFEREEHRK